MRKSPSHVSLMGKLGNELTKPGRWRRCWREDKIEGAMFDAVQKQRAVNSAEDIQRCSRRPASMPPMKTRATACWSKG
ncbi:hypothetical protein M8494_21720 [Serratia ureilytica]